MSAIARDRVEDVHALSPVQQGIFLHTLLEPERATYVEQAIWRIDGAVDPALFARAWNELVARHTVLRSVFRQARQQPVQIVLTQQSIDVPGHDWMSLPADAQHGRLADLAASERTPFRLADGPLLRLALVRYAAAEWRLIWTFHHIILDSLTVAMLLHGLGAIYDALAAGEPLPATTAAPFSRFVVWLAQQDRAEALRFWTTHLAGFATPTPFPGDRRPAIDAPRTHRACHVRVSRETTRALVESTRRRGVTLATLAQAAWAILLSRYSGEPDIVFGLTIAGRPADLPDVERIAGPFINTVPARVSLDGDPRLEDLLQALQRQRFDLDQHSHVSVADIQARTGIRGPAALFDTTLNVHPSIDWHGFRSKSFVIGVARDEGPLVERTNYDLLVDVALGERLGVTISYVEEIYAEATITALLEQMRTLFDAVAASDADVRVSALTRLSPDERTRVLDDLNRTDPAAAFEGGIVVRVEAQAARTPQATAVVAGEVRLSYQTLNARANQVARWLRAADLGREDRVAVFGQRDAGWLTFVLGILKAGAAFVPLDPLQPDARLSSIVSTAGIRVMACGAESAARALALAPSAPHAPAVVCWAAAPAGVAVDDASGWARVSTANPTRVTGARDLACVFFTSGSTGAPKGVMVEHAGIVNHVEAKIAVLGIDASSVVAQNASIGFDISVWQMLAALAVGGAVAIYEDEIAFDQSRLVAGLARDGVTILETVPSLMDALVDAASTVALPALRTLVSNAEFLPVPLCRRWLERFPHVPLVNTLGPTECSDDNAHYWQREPPREDVVRVPVGRPIPGGRIYVLDRERQPVPIGAPGEIALGGLPVGRGYLDDPIKTARSFVPDPFSPEPGSRMYSSGDVGRWTQAGVLEWLRRDGDQVKVRGHRIELGEIQSALLRYAGVRQAVAIVRDSAQGEPQIVAYWVGDDEVDPGPLREALAAVLPRYMLPSAIVRLDGFPVTSRGKLDRRALPMPSEEQPLAAFVAPADACETAIAEIWSAVLGIERVSATGNFYELGGQSLRTMQIRSRLVERFGVEIPLRAIFRHQTVREQARLVADALDRRASSTTTISRLPDAEAYALSHAQRRLWIQHQLDPADISYNLLAALSIDGPLDGRALERAWSAVVARHDGLRTTFAAFDGEPLQRVRPAAAVPLRQIDLTALPEPEQSEQLGRILLETKNAPFDLETPPVRALLVVLGAGRHVFAFGVHHLISDAWSGDVLLRDLFELYHADRSAIAPRLPPTPIRYVDYAAWQAGRFASGAFADDERYWMAQLAGELPALELPAPRAVPTGPAAEGHVVTFSIDVETAARLRQATADRDVTPFMLQLALVKAWLARVTGAEDLLVGSPVAGRDRGESEALVGFFVNLLALRTSLDGDPSFAALAGRVKRSCLDAYAHQEYPFDELVKRLNPRRHANRGAIFDVLFMSGTAGMSRTVDGLTIGVAPGVRDRSTLAFPGAQVAVFVMCLERSDGGLSWILRFDPARVDREIAEQATARFAALVREIARRPHAHLSALDALAASAQGVCRLQRSPVRDTYPLSIAQRDVWTASAGRERSPLGTLAMRVALDGPLDQGAFADALRAAANRHEALRLAFGVHDGVPFQRVAATVDLPLRLEDLTFLDAAARADRVRAIEDELARVVFDRSVAPLARAALLRLAPDRHVLVLGWHRLIVDRWHIGELLASVGECYANRLHGSCEDGVADPRAGPTDVAVWQQARVASGDLMRQSNYWRRVLETASASATLPMDRSPATERSFAAATAVCTVPPDTARALRALAKARRSTSLRVVASVVGILASRLVRARDVSLVVPMAARPRGAHDPVGSFVHDVPVLAQVDRRQSFAALVADVTARVSRAHDRREFAAGLDSGDRDAPHRRPVTVAVSRARRLDRTVEDVRMRADVPVCAASPYDLTVTLVADAGALELHLTYAVDHLEPATISRWSESLLAGLARAVAQPDRPIGRLDFLPDRERERLVHGVNATTTPYPSTTSVHRLFEAETAAHPHAPALGGGREWRYDALNRAANRLARRLVADGVRPGAIVAIYLDRSPELIVAVLATLKAGAAYLPLDVDEAPERLALTLADADTPLVITTAALAARLPPALATRTVALDRDAAGIAAQDAGNLSIDGGGGHLAYVMYTSGSTGRPKGVMIPHRGIVRLVRRTNYVTFDRDDRVAQIGKSSFDASTIEIWGALLNGGCLVIIPHDTLLSPAALSTAFEANGITVAFVTPALFQHVAREAPQCFSRMKTLLVGGDVVTPQTSRRILESGAPGRLVNAYGPTENTSLTTYQPIDVTMTESTSLPIGRPLSNTDVYIVDEDLQPVGVGLLGELWTGGAGLADGYLGRPELTAETFVPDPFSGVPGARLYRTGDVTSWRADGAIAFHGRADQQVKIRGHRIELGEIEAVLTQHDTVGDVVVVARAAVDGAKQLIAYVVPAPGATISVDTLRRHAGTRLPSYMVPAWVVPLPSLPLGRTGKVDRKALPEPEHDRRGAAGTEYAPPRTALEEEIASVWRQALDVTLVGIEDNFFELGGDSLQCLVVVSRLAERGIRVTPKAFYANATIAGLASVAEQVERPTAVVDQTVRSGPVPLVPIQRFFLELDLEAAHHWNVTALLRADRLDAGAVERALQAILDHHDALRMRYTRGPDGWRQENPGAGETVSFEVIDVGDDLGRLAAEGARIQGSFDLTRGSLFRAALFRLADGTDRLLVTAHHLVSDLVSGRILVDDLERAYEQALRGESVQLQAKGTSYGRWAEILEAHAPERIAELPYWQSLVAPGWPSLPLDHDRGPNTIASLARVRVDIDAPPTRVLLTKARQTLGMNMHDVLLAALGRAVAAWTAADSVGVLVERHGREAIGDGVDVNRTIGWFTSMFPIRLETPRGLDRSEYLQRTRTRLAAAPGDGLGYGLLRYVLRRPELAGSLPDVNFNYQGQVLTGPTASRFTMARDSVGPLIGTRSRRWALLNVECAIVSGRFLGVFFYSRHKHRAETIEALAERFAQELREIAALCLEAPLGAGPVLDDASRERAAAGV